MNKVLIISGTSIISGAEYVLADYLKESLYKENIIILHSNIKEINNFYEKLDIKNIKSKALNPVGAGCNKFFLFKKMFYFLNSFFVFKKILKDKDIKIVLGNNTGDVIYSFYSKLFNKKHINYIHDIIEKDSFLAKIVLRFDKYVDKYITVSNAVKEKLIDIGIDKNKIIVIYNGLKYQEFKLKELKNEIVFGFIGYIEKTKSPLEFIEFMKIANEKLLQKIKAKMVYGDIVDNDLFIKVKERIKKYNLDIELLGKINRDNIRNFYEDIHFLVVTSKKESLPTVILEAFNNSVPVIGKKVGGIPEMINDGENGFLYKSINVFDYDKLLKIDYKKMQINANNTIKEKFLLECKVKKLDNLLFKDNL